MTMHMEILLTIMNMIYKYYKRQVKLRDDTFKKEYCQSRANFLNCSKYEIVSVDVC